MRQRGLCFEAQKYFLAGLVLGLAAYKPSLLAIPAAMFLAGRCWKMVAGICISASLVVAACFAAAGVNGMKLWLQTLQVFRYMATEDQSILQRTKYLDINSFLVILGGLNIFTKTAPLLSPWLW